MIFTIIICIYEKLEKLADCAKMLLVFIFFSDH